MAQGRRRRVEIKLIDLLLPKRFNTLKYLFKKNSTYKEYWLLIILCFHLNTVSLFNNSKVPTENTEYISCVKSLESMQRKVTDDVHVAKMWLYCVLYKYFKWNSVFENICKNQSVKTSLWKYLWKHLWKHLWKPVCENICENQSVKISVKISLWKYLLNSEAHIDLYHTAAIFVRFRDYPMTMIMVTLIRIKRTRLFFLPASVWLHCTQWNIFSHRCSESTEYIVLYISRCRAKLNKLFITPTQEFHQPMEYCS